MWKPKLAASKSIFRGKPSLALTTLVFMSAAGVAVLMWSAGAGLTKEGANPSVETRSNARPGVLPLRLEGSTRSGPGRVGVQIPAVPLRFEENRGQAAKDVRFLARANGLLLCLTNAAGVLEPSPAGPADSGNGSTRSLRVSGKAGRGRPSRSVLRVELAKANPDPPATCTESSLGESNYFVGRSPSRWITHVPNCAKVRFQNIYPGVDLAYYGNHEELESDYILAPGIDPDRINLKLAGANSLRLTAAGDLLIDVAGSRFCLKKPLAYQSDQAGKKWVEARYAIRGANLVGFDAGPFDHTRALVVDPVLTYSTFLGGTGGDNAAAIALDASKNIYLVGTTSSTDFPTTHGVTQSSLAGAANVFVTKLSPAGVPLFSTYLGGSGSDSAAAFALDSSGNIYVTGTTSSTDYPTTSGVGQTHLSGPSDAFVTKLNPAGTSLLYSTYLGGSGAEAGSGIAVDSAGVVYLAGTTSSFLDFPIKAGSFQMTYGGGGSDAFILKLSADATSLDYSSFLGGSGSDTATGLVVNAAGEAYVTGSTSSTDFPTHSPLQAASAGGTDAFIAKFSADGSMLVYSTYLGGSGSDQGSGLALDGSGNLYLTGSTTSTDFPTHGGFQGTSGGGLDAFVAKLKPDGSALLYSSYLGGSGSDSGNGIALDSSGHAYVVGTTNSSDFPSVSPLESFRSTSSNSAFFATVAANGQSLTQASYLGGSGSDQGQGVALDSSGIAYVVGTTASSDFPVTLGSYQPLFGKISNVFLSKVDPADEPGFTVFPTQITFTDQGVGTTSSPMSMTIRNMGSAVLHTQSITTTGDFGETNTCGGVTSGGGECSVSLTFSPTARGARTGTVVVSDDASASPQTLNLKGTGVSPEISLSPDTLTFPTEHINTTAPTQNVSMHNAGADASTITSITTTGDFTQTNTCGTSLNSGASCTITVAFTPSRDGARSGTLSVRDNAAGSPHTVSLTGTGEGPDAKLSASTLSFGEQPLTTTSGAQTLTLTNDGSLAMTISGISTTGAFAESSDCGASVAVGASCSISVTFKPTVAGLNSGALTIQDNAPGSPQTVVLSGNAVSGSHPEAYLSPSTLTFTALPDSTTSASQTLTLTNTGNAALQITSTALTGSFTQGTNTCTGSIDAGATCTVQISAAPTAPGPISGAFSVTDNATGSPHVEPLLGGGTDFNMSVTPANATVAAGDSATYTITVTPVFGFNQTLSLSCDKLPQASSCAFSPAAAALDGTTATTVTLTVSTTKRNAIVPGWRWPETPKPPLPVILGIALLGASLMVLARAYSNRRVWLLGLLLAMLGWGACSVSTQKITGTLAGSYTFTLTGSYTSSGTLQHSVQLGLGVN